MNTFKELWFAPVDLTSHNADAIFGRRTSIIIDIMPHCRATDYWSFEQLLENVSHCQ